MARTLKSMTPENRTLGVMAQWLTQPPGGASHDDLNDSRLALLRAGDLSEYLARYLDAAKAQLAVDGPEIRSLAMVMDEVQAHVDRMIMLARPGAWAPSRTGQSPTRTSPAHE